jgi:hypothetical protein
MKPSSIFILASTVAGFGFLASTELAHSQGSGSSRVTPSTTGRAGQQGTVIQSQPSRPQTPDEFYAALWNFIAKKDAAYNTWNVLDRSAADESTENPHSSISRTYMNKIAVGDPSALPLGTILVREDYDGNRKRTAINVMYRVKDFDKEHGNWYWLKYQENGSIVRDENGKAVAGKVTSCIECHAKAGANDFVFSNDRPAEPSAPKPGETPGGKK